MNDAYCSDSYNEFVKFNCVECVFVCLCVLPFCIDLMTVLILMVGKMFSIVKLYISFLLT